MGMISLSADLQYINSCTHIFPTNTYYIIHTPTTTTVFTHRYVRREKDIAETKRELAESENARHMQLVEQLQRQLSEARQQLSEVNEAAKLHSETDVQHAEILKKVSEDMCMCSSHKISMLRHVLGEG